MGGLLAVTPEWLKPTAEVAADGALAMLGHARALTGPSSRWLAPAFVIVGSQRCGTTSMYRYLTSHPQVVRALTKEVHFFDNNYSRGPDWYAAHFVAKRAAESWSRAQGRDIITGEASPYYMFHPHAMARLHEMLPEVKIIVMLRDPVQRAISHYSHERAKGWETADLADAVRMEKTRLAGEEDKLVVDPNYRSFSHQHYGYLARGDYLTQLKRIDEFYPRDQIFLVNSNELYRDTDAGYQQILRYLGLQERTLPSYKRYNTYRSVTPDKATRTMLVRHFAPHNASLYEYLGRDFGWSR